MQKLLSKTRQAIVEYNLIEDGDKICLGLSGGKDSITLLHILNNLRKFLPEKFELIAVTLNPGGVDNSPLHELCRELNVEYHEVQTNIKEIVFDIRQEKNPCSLCANLRRGALNAKAEELGCNKVALGHHKDDALETFFMSLSFEGRINCFSPKSYMDKNNITLIRPMVFIDESMIIRTAKENNYPIIKNPCPADGKTNRQDIKELIKRLDKEIPGFKKNLFKSLRNSNQLFIWDKKTVQNM
ncbi:tRNA 2-thiocytidine biosynthesis TtcA family protein [Clostridium sp.]|uniref:tRNA 2-thiocytidine biosynthesis TtcA family protein n=1 Tax=Clostridium sp. TaxID=1506 RepID=UPI003991174A